MVDMIIILYVSTCLHILLDLLVKMHAGAISKLLYDFASVRAIIHSLKVLDYLPYRRTHHTLTSTCNRLLHEKRDLFVTYVHVYIYLVI